MQWHADEIGPTDLHWERLQKVDEVRATLAAEQTSGEAESHSFDLPTFGHAWQAAQDAAYETVWSGDFRNEPVIFWVPAESEFDFGFVIKQDNNGVTYVVSPVELPDLRR